MEKIKQFFGKYGYIFRRIAVIVGRLLPAAVILTVTFSSVVAAYTSDEGITGLDALLYDLSFHMAIVSLLFAFRVKKVHVAVKWVFAGLTPYLSFFLLELIRDNPLGIKFTIVLLNLALFLLVAVLVFFITGRTAPAAIVTLALPFIFGLVSHFTREFRGTPLFPWDLASYGTAAEVITNYTITFSSRVAAVLSAFVMSIQAAVKFNIHVKMKWKLKKRPICAVISAALLFGTVKYVQTDSAQSTFGLYPHLFTPDIVYGYNGFAVGFLMNLRYTTVEVPKNYSPDDVRGGAKDYPSDTDENAFTPNVIVIMNETFSDMTALCDFTTNKEYLPFISSLEENTIKGTLHSSVVGGNTPNSEFEFLTGMTMGFLPAGSIAYQQFVKSELPSFTTQLSELGYKSTAMHPFWASGWDRKDVYPLLGFDEKHFLDDGYFYDSERIRDYVSDRGVFEKITGIFEERKQADGSGEPQFVFAVTMQNHSGYWDRYDNFNPAVTVDGLEDNFEVSTYMSLIRETDSAFEQLISYFENYDEPTVILMYGDHQPNGSIASPLMKIADFSYADDDIEESEKRYIVPYIMWANFELNTDVPEETSINYMSAVLTKAAGMPQTGAQKQALSLMEKYPVINGRCIVDADGTYYPVSEYIFDDCLLDYAKRQYNYLFDAENRVDQLWHIARSGENN